MTKRVMMSIQVSGAGNASGEAHDFPHFAILFDRIAEGAVARERERILPFEQVRWLREAGFGAVRVPREFGGGGASLSTFIALLGQLATADSNVAQIFRAHFAFVENVLLNHDEARVRDLWFPRIVAGDLIGAAMSERNSKTEIGVRLTDDAVDGWRLNGQKFYCTGTLYADWMTVYALHDKAFKTVMVSTAAAGVTCKDDWDGFGQRMTASGTTVFEDVHVPTELLLQHFRPGSRVEPYMSAFFQLHHLATLSGIAHAALRDAIAYTRSRTRTFRIPGVTSPRDDFLVQRVVGRLSSQVFAIHALVSQCAQDLESLFDDIVADTASEQAQDVADIKVYQAQQIIIDLVLQATSLLFDVGGASALSAENQLDRHWRNARALASHNPAINREQALGLYFLNDVTPIATWRDIQKATGVFSAKAL